jgi:hemolysin III
MNDRQPAKPYSLGEEIANSITHGVGAALSIAGLVILVVYAATQGDAWHIVSFTIYGSSLILLYLASTLYHSFPHPKVKYVFRIIDHSSIFILIAGTYTPFMLTRLRGGWGWSLFGIVWGLAIAGIALKSIFINRFKKISVLVYILMGWLCIFALRPMIENIPHPGLLLLLAGGLCYTLGVVFYTWKSLAYSHAVWHLFVLGGSACHYFSILFYLLPAAG